MLLARLYSLSGCCNANDMKLCPIPCIYYQPLKTMYIVTGPIRIQVLHLKKFCYLGLLAQFLGLSDSPNTFDDNLGYQTKHILQKKLWNHCRWLRDPEEDKFCLVDIEYLKECIYVIDWKKYNFSQNCYPNSKQTWYR